MKRSTAHLRRAPTWGLRFLDAFYDGLPAGVMPDYRAAIKNELLARELPSIADESGGFLVAGVRGVQ